MVGRVIQPGTYLGAEYRVETRADQDNSAGPFYISLEKLSLSTIRNCLAMLFGLSTFRVVSLESHWTSDVRFSNTHRSTRLAASDCKTTWSSRGIGIDNIYLDHPMDFPFGRLYVPAKPGNKARTEMAQVIQFYIPTSFQRKVKWVAPQQRGKVIQFQREVRKSA
jgi:hypothetical protein